MKPKVYIRASDGMPVTEEEAVINGVLQDGYSMSIALRFDDHAMQTGGRPVTLLNDTVQFMDHLPGENAGYIAQILQDVGSSELFRVRRGGQQARDLAYKLYADSVTYGSSLVTDTQRAAGQQGFEYLQKVADQAKRQEADLYGRFAAGDRTVDVGVDRDASARAREAYTADLQNAWKGTQARVETVAAQTTDTATTTDTRSAYERMCDRDRNAWKMGENR